MTSSIWKPGSSNVPVADPRSQIKSQIFTATAGQTDFTLTQFTYNPNGGAIEIFVSGVKRAGNRVNETSTSTFSLLDACEAGEIVEAVGNTEMASADGAAVTAVNAAADALAYKTGAETAASDAEADRIAAETARTAAEDAAASINPATYLAKASNLSDVPDKSVARTNLGLAIGVDVQAYDVQTAKKNVANVWTATQTPDNSTDAVAAGNTYTFNGGDQVREITVTGAGTITFGAPTGIVEHSMYKFKLKAGDTSVRTFAWNAAYKFPAATPPLTSGTVTNGAKDIITFVGGPSNTLEYEGHQADLR